MRRTNVLVCSPNPKDSTSLYRGLGPLGELQRSSNDIGLNFVTEYSWASFALNDVFFMQRPYSGAHLDMLLMAKDNGVPVWVDYDDDLFSVPASNPAHKAYSNEQTKTTVAKIIANADIVSVSTAFLKRQFEKGPTPLNKDIRVIPNAINTRLLNYRTTPTGERHRMISWRGSCTHHKDLHHFMAPLVKSINQDASWAWLFQGDKPWFLFERLGSNAIFAESIDPILYFKQMHDTKPPVMIAPLHDCEFNRSKSNIVWLEGAFFGAMTIGPDWEEWIRPGCINYKDVNSFGEILEATMRGQYNPNAETQKAWTYIMDCLTLDRVNQQRKQIIQDLVCLRK